MHKKIVECDGCCKVIHGNYYSRDDTDYCSLECMAKNCLGYVVKKTI